MELLSNLVWLAVAISLWGLWVARLRAPKGSLLPAVTVQLMSLAIITAISLPAISLTDDLHACQLPAEVKRSAVQVDRQLFPVAAAHELPFALLLLALCINLLRPLHIAFLAMEQRASLQQMGSLSSLWSRPPPPVCA